MRRAVRLRAGPADSIAVLGLAEACRINIVLFVPPRDEAKPRKDCRHHYCKIQASTAKSTTPTMHVGISCGHFQALEKPTNAISTNNAPWTLLDLMIPNLCPGTAKCAACLAYHPSMCMFKVVQADSQDVAQFAMLGCSWGWCAMRHHCTGVRKKHD